MRFFASLIASLLPACLLLATPVWAEGVVHHLVQMNLNPAQGQIDVSDVISLDGEGRTAFALSPAFVVKGLSVDGKTQPPARTDGGLLIDLGDAGRHEIRIDVAAKLSTQEQASQPPFLSAEGGFLSSGWLPHPPDALPPGTSPGKRPWGKSGSPPDGWRMKAKTPEPTAPALPRPGPAPCHC